MPSRRAFHSALAALRFTHALRVYSQPRPRFSSDPFKLGVASGYPSHQGLTLWTRLAPAPTQPDGGLDPAPIPVRWEISPDERFSSIAATGTTDATPEWAHSVHVEWITSDPARRGRGYGEAMTWEATLAWPDLPATLIASDAGRPTYERMGYLSVLRVTLGPVTTVRSRRPVTTTAGCAPTRSGSSA